MAANKRAEEPKRPKAEPIKQASDRKPGYEPFGPRLGRKRVDGLGRGWC